MKKHYCASWNSIKTHTLPSWYHSYKFGIFIHWGIYSVPAFAPVTWELGEVDIDEQWFCNNPYAEWYFNSINVKQGPSYQHHLKTYGKNFKYNDFLLHWKAELWQPEQWAELFKQSGAKYIVITAKHHDGFCLFQSKYTNYHSINYGPGCDIVKKLKYAVEQQGLKLGIYYSGIIDWQFVSDPIFTEAETRLNTSPTYEYADYAYKQIIELIDNYSPALLWNDIGWPKQGENMLPYIFSHYYNKIPDGVVNNRWNGLWHDFTCKEYKQGEISRDHKWEMCRGIGLSFGYNQNETPDSLISVKNLISLLVEVVANNGNLLLNIGPKANGIIPEEQIERLQGIGEWLKINGEAIYDTVCSKHTSCECEKLKMHFTCKNTDLYVFLDGLQPGYNEININTDGAHNIYPLNSKVNFSKLNTTQGLKLIIENYQDNWNVLCFKISGGETGGNQYE